MKGRGAWLLRALGLGLFIWLIGRADWSAFSRVFAELDAPLLFILPVLTAIMIGLRAWRWNLLLAVREQALPLGRAWGIYAIGLFLGSVTPGRLGDLAKAWYVRGEGQVDWDQALAGALTDRLFDVAFMAVLAVWALFQLEPRGLWSGGGMGLYMVSGLGFALFFATDWRRWLQQRRAFAFLLGLKDEVVHLVRGAGPGAALLTLLGFAVYFTQTVLLARALGLMLAPGDVVAAIVLVGLAAFLPISVAGFGTREGLLALVFAHRAVPNSLEMALAYSGLFFGFCFAVPALMGFACWLKNPLSLAELKAGTARP